MTAALLFAGLVSPVAGQDIFTWNGGGADGSWSLAANWAPGVPDGGGNDLLRFAGGVNLVTNNNLAGWTGTAIEFGPTAGAFTLGGSALSLGVFGGAAPVIRNDSAVAQLISANVNFDGTSGGGEAVLNAAAGDLTLGGAVTLNGTTTLVIRGGGGRTVTISGPINGGTNGVRVAQDNILVLAGANNYTGATAIDAGALHLSGSLASGSAVSVGSAATPAVPAAFLLAGAGGGVNVINPITIQPGDGTNRILGGTNTSGTQNFSGPITLAGGGDSTLTLTAAGGGTVNIVGVISGGSGIIKSGDGVVQLLVANTYAGPTLIQQGSLRLGGSEVLPNTGAVTINGGALEMQSNSDTVGAVTLISGSISGIGTLTAAGYTMQDGSVSAILAGSGGLVKQTAGTVSLTGNNSFTGGVQILDGTLSVASDAGLGSTASNNITINGGRLNASSSFTTNRVISLAASANNGLAADAVATVTFNGVLAGAGGFTKTGLGTVVFGGGSLNVYAGLTTVTEGTLVAGRTAGVNAIPGDLLIDLNGTFRLQTSDQIANTASVTINGGFFNNPLDANPPQNSPVDTVANLTINGGAFGSNRSTLSFGVTTLFKVTGGSALVSRGGSMTAPKLEISGGTVDLDGGSTTAGQESRLAIGAGGITISGGQINFNSGPSGQAAGSMGGLILLSGNITSTGVAAFTRFVNATPRAVINLQGAMRTISVETQLGIGGATTGEAINLINGGITKTGPGTLVLSGYDGATAYIGGLIIQEGKVQFGTAAALGGNSNVVTPNGHTLENISAGEVIVTDATAARVINVGTAGVTFSSLQGLGSTNFERAGSLIGSGPILKEGIGALRVRADNVGLSSNWTVNGGALEVATPLSLGTGTVTVNANGLLAIRSSATVNTPFNSNITLAGGTLGTRTGDFSNFAGNVDVTAPSFAALRSYSTPANAQSFTISGMLSGNGDLTIVGATVPSVGKALTLSNAGNTYSGIFRVGPLQNLVNQSATGVGKTLGIADVELTNSILSLRDDGTGNDGLLAYGNDVTLAGANNSQIDVNRAAIGAGNTGNTFQLGTLGIGAQALIVTGANGYKLEFTGATTLSGNAVFATNSADLTLSGPVDGAFGITKVGAGKLTLGSANTYTGATSVQAGILQFNHLNANAGANGSITVVRGAAVAAGFALDQSFLARLNSTSDGILALSTNSAGALDFSPAGANLPSIRLGAINRSELSGSLVMSGNTYRLGGGGGTLVVSGANTLTGTASLDVDAAGTPAGHVALTNVQNFSGETTVRGASLILGGPNGALTSTSAITVSGNSTLMLDNDGTASGAPGVNANRLPDALPITLSRGTIHFRQENNAGGGTNTETIGAVTYAAASGIRVDALGGPVTGELTAQSFTRSGRGTLTLQTTSPGSLGGSDRIKSVVAPAVTNGMVAPHIVSGTDAAFAGYGANGFVPAPFTSIDLTTSTATDITDASAVTLLAPANAYALRLGTGSVTGSGVTVGSGGLILNATSTHTSELVFNNGSANVEALVFSAPGTTATLSGNVTASGLTKFGTGVVHLNGVALFGTLAGPLTVQAGTLSIGADNVGDNLLSMPQFVDVTVEDGGTLNLFQTMAIRNVSGTGTIRMGNTNTARRTLGLAPASDTVFSGTLSTNNDGVASATGTAGGQASLHTGGRGDLEFRDARLNGFREFHVLNSNVTLSGTTTLNEMPTRGRLEIHQGASFTLDNQLVNNFDRIGLEYQTTTEPGGYFRLSGGTFNFVGNPSAFSSEFIGRSNGAGLPQAPSWGPGTDVINVIGGNNGATPAAIAFLTDNPALGQVFQFVREQGASVLVRGTGLGLGNVGAGGVTNVLLSSTPVMAGGGGATGTTAVSIMPGVIASSVIANADVYGLATNDFGPNGVFSSGGDDIGIRRLTTAEMTTTIADGALTTDNVQLSSNVDVNTAATINALHLSAGGSVGGSGTLTVNSGTILAAGGANGGIGVATPGALDFSISEGVIFAANDLEIGSVVSGASGLTVGGTARVLLTNPANTISGPVIVNGHLSIPNDGALGASGNALSINFGGTLELAGSFTLSRNLRIGTLDARLNVPPVASYDARVAVPAGQTAVLSGEISGGLGPLTNGISSSTGLLPNEAAALVKQGTGTLVLTGVNTFTGGTLVQAGTLTVNGSLPGDSPVTVQAGGTLSGAGTVQGSVLIQTGGTLAAGPAAGSAGILNLSQNVLIAPGGGVVADLAHGLGGQPIPGTDYDQLNIGTGGAGSSTATVGLGNATLALNLGAGIVMGDLFFILLNDGVDPISGTFAGLSQGAEFTSGGQMFQISYLADANTSSMTGGNDVGLLAVPEPAASILLLGGVVTLAARRRRRES